MPVEKPKFVGADDAVRQLRGGIGVSDQIAVKPQANADHIRSDIMGAPLRSWFAPDTIWTRRLDPSDFGMTARLPEARPSRFRARPRARGYRPAYLRQWGNSDRGYTQLGCASCQTQLQKARLMPDGQMMAQTTFPGLTGNGR